MRRPQSFLLLAALLPLAACVVGPDYRRPVPPVPPGFVRAGGAMVTTSPGVARWWDALRDPLLSRLVDDALAHSPTIEVAEARIRQARASLRQQRASNLPSADLQATFLEAKLPGIGIGDGSASSGQSSFAGLSSNIQFYNLGLNASWEPDLFGGERRGLEQARAEVGRGYASLADVQVSLAAEVAQTYVDLRDVQQRTLLDVQRRVIQRRMLPLGERRRAAGVLPAQAVESLRRQLAAAEAEAASLGAEADEDRDRLAMLTGRGPGSLDAVLAAPAPTPSPPAATPIGDPAALIARRPDVRQAERALASSTAAVGVAKAKLFPSVKFSGLLGLGGTDPGDVFDLGKLTTLLTPQLTWAVLDFGKNRAAVRQSEGAREEAEAHYREVVLGALRDAEASLSRFAHDRTRLAALAQADAAAARTAALDRLRLRAGTEALSEELETERQALSAHVALGQGESQLTRSYIAVQKSLGLGWEEPSH